uniref:Uncharacterized protein n=1 Tax=Triticum urartu TaxID=4572 RepID=A0A8R7RAP8_TRIUA
GEGASDASKAVASSTYASPWGSLCCWRTAAAPLVWCETSRSPGGWGWRMAFPQLLIGGERGMEQQAHSSLNHHANLFLLFILNLWCTYSTCLFFLAGFVFVRMLRCSCIKGIGRRRAIHRQSKSQYGANMSSVALLTISH